MSNDNHQSIGRTSWVRRLFILLIFVAALMGTACQASLLSPPRLATATAQASAAPTATHTPIVMAAPTTTAVSGTSSSDSTAGEPVVANPVISVWVNETSAEHEAALEAMAQQFSDQYQIDVALNLVSPMLMPDLVQTAVLSGTLPDIIIHPLDYSVGWAEQGILNSSATSDILNQLDSSTFNSNALSLLTTPDGLAALPSDGYQHLLTYRTDWAEERNLAPPTSYDAMFAFAEATFDLEVSQTAGFVIPTESNLVTTHQMYEHLATANGCELIDTSGEVTILDPACQEAIDFYFNIVHNFSPPGVQTDTSTRNAYLGGRSGMIMTTPTILPMLAGIDTADMPVCPECASDPDFLAQNSAFITNISGFDDAQSASFGSLTLLGITQAADVETASLFADYWFNEGYEQWLAVESERKVPMRLGTAVNPTQYIDAWGTQPLGDSSQSLTDIYGADVVATLRNDPAVSNRWGFAEGQGGLVAKLYQEQTLSIVLQEMLSGYFNTSQTNFEAYNRFVELIPNYQFALELEPTPTPDE